MTKSLETLHVEKNIEIYIGKKPIKLTHSLMQAWYETYPKEFLELELKKARNWVLANPHKAPKSQWGRFFNSWLSRGWEDYRKTLKSNPVKLTEEEVAEILRGED